MRRGLPALLTALALAVPARADNAGVTAVPILQVPLWARAAGMGTAFTAVASDASSLFYNPAGMARLNAQELGVTFAQGVGDSSLQSYAYAGPTPFTGVSGNGYTSVGATLLYARNGNIEVNTLNTDGSLGKSENKSAGSDLVAAAGYAERVGMTPLELREGTFQLDHYLGATGKYVRSSIIDKSASTYATDVGYLAHAPELGVTCGASLLNLGGKIRYDQQDDPLPKTVRSGFAWQGGVPSIHYWLAALDADYVLDERQWHVNVGGEYFWVKTYGVRLGYQINRDDGGLTVGFGLRWRGRVLVDYAWGLGRLFRDSHRITISYRFGGVPPSQRSRQRRPFIEQGPEHEEFRDLQEQMPKIETPRPRLVPRERGDGVPGWIY